MKSLDTNLDSLVDRTHARLAAGAAIYGDTSFTRPAADLVDGIQQEVAHVGGWSLLLWPRLERLRDSVDAANLGDTDERT